MRFRRRADGGSVRNLPRTCRIMPLLMRRRNESIVFFEQQVVTTKALRFLQEFLEGTGLRATR